MKGAPKGKAGAKARKNAARVIRAEKAVRLDLDKGKSASDLRASAKAARSAEGATLEDRLKAAAQMRAAADVMRAESGRKKGQGTRYVGPKTDAARESRFLDPRTKWEEVNIDLKGDMSLEDWRAKWGETGSQKYKDMQEEQARRYEEMFGEKPPPKVPPPKVPPPETPLDDGGLIGPGGAGTGYPFPGMELGVGFPKSSKGYQRSFADVPEYGGDVAAQSLLGYTPSWAGRDSSDWGILDPRAYGPPQQVMPWMGPTGQQPLQNVRGRTQVPEGGFGSGSRAGQRDWVSGGKVIPPIGTTAWKPTPYSAAEIANWQRFNQGLLAPPIEFGGQPAANQLAQFGLGTGGGLLNTTMGTV